ncbi:MAG: flagellar motor protein MotB [Phycisphaerae bacterium]|nr:flagellar motor protein MotB [Phycisphaerae bacterium]
MADHGDKHEGGEHKKAHKSHAPHGAAHEGEEGGAPEWLISFADMVMLMMGFFVIMFALNVQPKGGNAGGGGEQEEGVANEPDFIDFAIAVRKAFHTLDNLDEDNPVDQKLIQRIQENQGAGESRDDGTKGQDKNVKDVRPMNHYGKGTMVNFPLRSTVLDEASGLTLVEFAKKHRGRNSVLELRGHASVAESYKKPEEAMSIGFERAMAAARALEGAGIEWARLRIVSAGDNERADAFPNEENADAKNARVEVRVTDEIAAPRSPTAPTGTGDAAPPVEMP